MQETKLEVGAIFEGKVTGRFRAADVTREEIGYYMTGGRQDTKEAEAR